MTHALLFSNSSHKKFEATAGFGFFWIFQIFIFTVYVRLSQTNCALYMLLYLALAGTQQQQQKECGGRIGRHQLFLSSSSLSTSATRNQLSAGSLAKRRKNDV